VEAARLRPGQRPGEEQQVVLERPQRGDQGAGEQEPGAEDGERKSQTLAIDDAGRLTRRGTDGNGAPAGLG
jgi:hypothetical protein